jgi:hypothetical protein
VQLADARNLKGKIHYNMCLGKNCIIIEDLAEKIGFSKPIIYDTLRKLWK